MKTYKVIIKSVVYNKVEVEADNEKDALDKANELVGEIDLYEGDVAEQYPARVL